MIRMKYKLIENMGLLSFFFIVGCVNYANFNPVSQDDNAGKITLVGLFDNWQDYHVYYDGSISNVKGVLFDLKSDENRIEGETWIRVSNEETLARLHPANKDRKQSYRKLWEITDPDGKFYGYISMTGRNNRPKAIIKDNNVIYFQKIPQYSHDRDPGRNDND